MDRAIDRGGMVGIALITVLMVATAIVNYRNTVLLNENSKRLDEAHEVLELTNGVLLGLVNTETGERGYLLTQRDDFLRPYTDALPVIEVKLTRLQVVTRDNSALKNRTQQLEEMTRSRLALLKDRIDLRRRRAPDVNIFDAANKGKAQMDAVRTLIADMEVDERAELETRNNLSTRAFHIAVTTGMLGAIAGLVFLGAFVVVLNRSLTARHAAMQLVAQQGELFRTTLASIGDAVITTDNSAKVTFLNPIAEAMTGWTDEAARGQPLSTVFQIVNEETRQPIENPAAKALREGAVVGLSNHTVLLARDGTEFAIDDSAAPIRNKEGTVSGVVLVFRDITERLRAEKSLRDADRLKDEYLAMLAHELRNPLAPIRNSLQILKQPAASAEVRERAREMAERQVKHMALLLDDLLDVARISSGRIELRMQQVDIVSLARRTVETVRPFMDEQRHEFIVTLPNQAIYAKGDPTRLEQILINLLNNAAKYTRPGGKIWLNVTQVDDDVQLHVRDNGIGISPDMLPHIFELFVQAQRREDRSQGGIGIGLTLVRKLVELHKGRVEAQSAGLGAGSEFTAHLPALPTSALPLPAATPVASRDSRKSQARKILVVDDNKDAAETLGVLLRISGHEVRVTTESTAALAIAREFGPEIVFLDIGMPIMDGYQVAHALRHDGACRRSILVALTGWGQEEDRRRSQEAGFDLHLVKPVEPEILNDLLDNWESMVSRNGPVQ